jgi:flagellar hook-associated protein 3 FlgL
MTSLEATQAAMGAQLSELNSYSTINGDQTLQDQTQMSSIVDLNYANGASRLTQQQTQYQAALQSYSAISKLSLFQYL